MKTKYDRLNKAYHVIMMPLLALLFFLFYDSVQAGTTVYRLVSSCVAVLFFGSSELYYANISREDLERRYGFAYYVMKGKASLEYLYQLLINDARALFLTIGGVYFLHVFMTGNFIPYIPYVHEAPSFDATPNIFIYVAAIITTSTLPMQLRLKKEMDDSSEIINESSLIILENFPKVVHVIDENRFLYNQLLNRIQDEVKVVQNEARFQTIIKGMNWKMEIFKILMSMGMSFI